MPERLHNALKRSPIADGVKRAIGQHRQGEGGLERWGETLQPVVNPWGMPEWAALRGEQLCAVRSFQAAVAGEYGGIALMNPAGSNTIMVVEDITVATDVVAMNMNLEVVADSTISGTYAVVTNPSCARDRRFKGTTGLSRATFRQGTDPANTFGAQLEQQSALVGPAAPTTRFQVALPCIIRPGDDLLVVGQTVNVQFRASWGWRERQAFPGELA